MIEFTIYDIKIRLRFDFFAAAAFMNALSDPEISVCALLCCILHELGHIAAMLAVGAKPRSVLFYGAGIMIAPDRHKLLPVSSEAAVLSAGCAVNFLLFLLSAMAGSRFALFGAVNLFIGAFNLLPAAGLDGGRLLGLFLEDHFTQRTASAVSRAAGCVSAVLLCGIMAFIGVENLTVIIAAAFMMISSMMV